MHGCSKDSNWLICFPTGQSVERPSLHLGLTKLSSYLIVPWLTSVRLSTLHIEIFFEPCPGLAIALSIDLVTRRVWFNKILKLMNWFGRASDIIL